MIENNFDKILSLGGDCNVSLALRRANFLNSWSPFDWMVTPLDAISKIVSEDGADLAKEFYASHNGSSVGCKYYNVLYHHEFPRKENHMVMFSIEAIETCRSKLRHKMGRFIEACEAGQPVLFIRFRSYTDIPEDRFCDGKNIPSAADINHVAQAIAARYPALDFKILYLERASDPQPTDLEALDQRIMFRRLDADPSVPDAVAQEMDEVIKDIKAATIKDEDVAPEILYS